MRKLLLPLMLVAMLDTPATSSSVMPYRKSLTMQIMQNWQPKHCIAPVVISLVIAKDGKLLKHAILQSSGSKKCDQEALHAVNETDYAPLPKWYLGGPLEFKIRLDPAVRLYDLAIVSSDHARYVEAEQLLKRALAITKKALGSNHPDVAYRLHKLAVLYERRGRYMEAEQLYQRSLAIRQAALPTGHPDVNESLNDLATFYNSQGKYSKAENLYKQFGRDDSEAAANLSNLAEIYRVGGKYAKAELLYKRALAIDEKTLGTDHPRVATLLEMYSTLLRKTNRVTEAEQLEARASAIRAKSSKTSVIEN